MKPQNYSERKLEVDGWQVNLTIYQLGDKWHAKADNVSPGAALARIVADSFGTFAINSGGFGPGVMQNFVSATRRFPAIAA